MTRASSEFFVSLMTETFAVSRDQVLVTGLPRNDILFLKTKNKELLHSKEKYSRIYNWVPTYRESRFSDGRIDSKSFDTFTELFDTEKLNEVLGQQNALLIIKPLPMEAKSGFYMELAKESNVLLASNDWFSSNDISLYELLSIVDVLWTDYSSVFIDFLVLNKDIFFIIPDFDEYELNRGFSFDYDKNNLPSQIIESFGQLIYFIKYIDLNKNNKSTIKFNDFTTGNTNRLLDIIFSADQ